MTAVRHLSTESSRQSLHIVAFTHLLCPQARTPSPPLRAPLSPVVASVTDSLHDRGWRTVTTVHSRSHESAQRSLHVIPLVSFSLAFKFTVPKFPMFANVFGGNKKGKGKPTILLLLAVTQIWSTRILRSRNNIVFFLVQARGLEL